MALTEEHKAASARAVARLWQAVAAHCRGELLDAHMAGDEARATECAFIADGYEKDAARFYQEAQDVDARAEG